MPWVSQRYLDYIGPEARERFLREHTPLGYHPETGDNLLVPIVDRFAGMYITGVQGTGKSNLLQNLIAADMMAGRAIIVLDPHGDLIANILSAVPHHRLQDTYILDMEDEAYPFGVNLFSVGKMDTSVTQTQAVDRLMHVFEVLWPDVLGQQNLPRYVRATAIALLANPGSTLVDMYDFLLDSAMRSKMLANVTDATVKQFWQTQYEDLSNAERMRRVQPLINRLESLFMGRSLIRNIVGQRKTTINIRKAIEARQVILVKLPLKTIAQDAKLIGTILLSQIHNAIFSFGDVPEAQRPGVSLYVDEFQHFSTPDFAELFTESRKFGMRLTLAHQYRAQLPNFLRDSTLTARTKICFQLTPEDGREMAHFFPSTEASIRPEDIEPHVTHHLMTYGSDDPAVRTFIDTYLLPLQRQRRGNRIEIDVRGLAPSPFEVIGGGRADNPRMADPIPYLDSLLYQVMRSRDAMLPIPPEVVIGFSGCESVFFKQVAGISPNDISLSNRVCFPRVLVVQAPNGGLRWTRKPEGATEQFFHFIFHLRSVMYLLAQNPLGKATTTPASAVAQMLTSLPRRAAFVRTADTVGVIYTQNTPPPLPPAVFKQRLEDIMARTRTTYCRPRAEVESSAQPTDLEDTLRLPAIPPPLITRWEETD